MGLFILEPKVVIYKRGKGAKGVKGGVWIAVRKQTILVQEQYIYTVYILFLQ